MLWDEDLTAVEDAEELCRQLLASPGGWGSSTRHTEAVELLANVHGSGELSGSFVALMLCTCLRWDRVTAGPTRSDEDTFGEHRSSFEPPLRRWAAGRALRADPTRLEDLLERAQAFAPRHRDVLIHGARGNAAAPSCAAWPANRAGRAPHRPRPVVRARRSRQSAPTSERRQSRSVAVSASGPAIAWSWSSSPAVAPARHSLYDLLVW